MFYITSYAIYPDVKQIKPFKWYIFSIIISTYPFKTVLGTVRARCETLLATWQELLPVARDNISHGQEARVMRAQL